MSQRAMPFLFLNMTGEMAYILEQRLMAQQITQAKCKFVLTDILKVVFNTKFLSKLFDPQEQYSRTSLRQFFEKMAHSSVMRLNEPSMDRLFDMMTMTVKQQMMTVDEPRQILDVTINHLNGIKEIVGASKDIVSTVNYAYELLINTYANTATWEMALIRHALLNFFQDLRIRVSQMMRLGIQLEDGRFVLHGKEIRIPYENSPPGSVRYLDKGQVTKITTLVMPEKYLCLRKEAGRETSTQLGENIFVDDEMAPTEEKRDASRKATGADEMKLLSKLIGRPANDADNFVLSLFEGEEVASGAKPPSRARSRSKERASVKVNKSKTLADAIDAMDIQQEQREAAPRRSRGEQMLKMMDEASAAPAPRARSSSKKSLRNREPSAAKK